MSQDLKSENKKKRFKKLFGLEPDEVSESLVISPFFFSRKFREKIRSPQDFRGLIFHGTNGVYQGQRITFINTGIGQALSADCVLAQEITKARKIIFLGAAGAISDFSVAENAVISRAWFDPKYYENLSIRFGQGAEQTAFLPDLELLEKCKNINSGQGRFRPAEMISIHTLWDQDDLERFQRFKLQGIDLVDLECALFYAAAKKINVNALGLCFISDHVLRRPYWNEFDPSEKSKVKNSMDFLQSSALELCLV